MTKSPSPAALYEYKFVQRGHVLLTSLVTTVAALLFLLPDYPFAIGYMGVCIASAIFHLLLFLVFDRVTPAWLNVANVINLFMLALSVHYTGGILSPFNGVFVLVLLSGAGYGVKMPLALLSAIGFYVGIIFAEKYGYLEPVHLTPAVIYESWPATLMIVISVVSFMLSSGSIYRVTVNSLREKIARELEIKEGIKSELVRLEAPSQVGLLVNKIAHDMRGPLTSLAGFIQLLREENDLSEESQKDCEVFLQELTRVGALINGMLKFVKPGQAGREPLFPPDVIRAVLSVISFFPGANAVQFTTDFPPADSFQVLANKHELQQVFFNVFKNSIEAFMPGTFDRAVAVSVRRDGDIALIVIKDNGPGIPASLLVKLSRDALSSKEQGSGVGLVIVRDIIEGHGGTLEVNSKVGEGTSIVATIPIHHNGVNS